MANAVNNTNNTTEIIAKPGVQEVFIIREFNAPRELVFRAHSEKELLEQWVGPKNRGIRYERFDGRSGGAYRFWALVSPGGEAMVAFHGSIHEVSAPERIIQTFEFEGLPERGHVALESLTFEELENNRTRITIHSVFRSVADRDAMIASGMEIGVREGHEKLDRMLEAGLV